MARREPMSGGTPATVALAAAAVAFTTHPYAHDPTHPSFGLEAAQALGVNPAVVFKTLVASLDDGGGRTPRLAVAIVPVVAMLDLKAVATALGGKRADLARPADAERVTGYVVGGISPFGQRRRLPTVVDGSALEHPTVYVSGGRRGFDVGVSPTDLVRLTAAVTAPIARPG